MDVDGEVLQLVEEKRYDEILGLEGEEYNDYKCVTLIKTRKYKDAIKYAKPLSFELAYINYKLRKFKKCLEIIEERGCKETKFDVLKSQALYSIGRYNDAYSTLVKCPLEDEVIVNLEAMKSMSLTAYVCENTVPSKYSLMKKDETIKFRNFFNHNFAKPNMEEEFRYNESFRYLRDEKKYVSVLMELTKRYKDGVIRRQMDNVLGNLGKVNTGTLRGCNREILRFNKGEETSFKNPVHYQTNFVSIKSRYWPANDYICYRKAHILNYCIGDSVVPSTSKNLCLLNAFLNLKKMFRGERFTRKFFQKKADTLLWEAVDLLSMKNSLFLQNQDRVAKVLAVLSEN